MEQLIRNNFPYLRAHTNNLNAILVQLYSHEIFSSEEWQELENKYVNPTIETTCDNLYKLLIRKKISQDLLREILTETENQQVIEKLWADGVLPKDGQIFWEVPQRNELFTGRKNLLEIVQARFFNTLLDFKNSISKFVIHGMGGIGKSSTALEFVYQNKDKFSHIFWFKAAFEENLKTQFTQLSKKLINSENVEQLLVSWFEKPGNQNWLIILDNVEEDNKGIRKFLPRWGGHVLITSRNQFWPPLISTPMPEFEDSIQMIEKILGKKDDEFHKLSQELGNLPLAIFNACQFLISNPDTAVSYYLDLFEKNCEYFMKYENKLEVEEKTIYSSVKITLDKIQSEDPLAYSWLQMVGYLDPDNIHIDTLQEFIEIHGQGSSEIEYVKTKSIVLKYGIVKLQKNEFSIHRLVQKTIQLCNNENGSSENVLKSAFNSVKKELSRNQHAWSIFPHLIKKANEISIIYNNNIEERNEKLTNFHEMVYQISDIQSRRPNLLKILPISKYEKYYQNMKSILKSQFKNLVGLFRLMGAVYHVKLDCELSLKFYLKALNVEEINYGVNNKKSISTLEDLHTEKF